APADQDGVHGERLEWHPRRLTRVSLRVERIRDDGAGERLPHHRQRNLGRRSHAGLPTRRGPAGLANLRARRPERKRSAISRLPSRSGTGTLDESAPRRAMPEEHDTRADDPAAPQAAGGETLTVPPRPGFAPTVGLDAAAPSVPVGKSFGDYELV